MNASVLVMAEAPEPGRVKPRLEPLLGPDGCARLERELIRHALAWAESVASGAVFAACSPSPAALGELMPPTGRAFEQEGDHLGERLLAATIRVFEERPGPLIVIGTNTPTLGRSHRGSRACRGGKLRRTSFDGHFWPL